MPSPELCVTAKPLIAIQLLEETLKPLVPPITVTVAPGAAWKTMGALAVPELATLMSAP